MPDLGRRARAKREPLRAEDRQGIGAQMRDPPESPVALDRGVLAMDARIILSGEQG